MGYYVQGEDLICSVCEDMIEPSDANICPVCGKIICKNCSEDQGEFWCPDDNEQLDDFENYVDNMIATEQDEED